MHQKPVEPREGTVACEVCLMEIPKSAALSHEASEYVYYFCGDDCFRKWQQAAEQEQKNAVRKDPR
jgi:YHS domain-containing protein